MSFILVYGEVGLTLALYLFHAIVLVIPFATLLRCAGHGRGWAMLAFLPVISRLACVLCLGLLPWRRRAASPPGQDAPARDFLEVERLHLALIAPFGLLASLALFLLAAGEVATALRYGGASGLGLGPRDRFFLSVFAAGTALVVLILLYIWSLWRGARLICRRAGYADIWALYIFVPGFNVLLPWVLASRLRGRSPGSGGRSGKDA